MKRCVALLLLTALLLTACAGQTDQTGLVFVYKQEETADGFRGVDCQGQVWQVSTTDTTDSTGVWVRYTGDAQTDADGTLVVTADAVWYKEECDKADFGEAYDTLACDYDGDGVTELCVIARYADSEPEQYELSIWDGDTRECHAYFSGGGAMDALAFDWQEDDLVIRSVNWLYGDEDWTVVTYSVTYQGGRLTVSQKAEE